MEQLEDYLKNLIKENKKVNKIKLFTIKIRIRDLPNLATKKTVFKIV